MSRYDIHSLAESGNVGRLRQAVQTGENVNQKDKFGSTALHAAIAEKQVEVVSVLLELGADAGIQDANGATALHYAVEYSLPDALASLVERLPAAVNISDKHGNQPLWTAVFNARGNYEMVSLLLRYGANPNHRNNAGVTPLDMSRRFGEVSLTQLLERAGTMES